MSKEKIHYKKELRKLFENYTQFIQDRIVEKYFCGDSIICLIKGNWATQSVVEGQYTLATYTLIKSKYIKDKLTLNCEFKNLDKI
jgi:hypothetical protein